MTPKEHARAMKILGRAIITRAELQDATDTRWQAKNVVASYDVGTPSHSLALKMERYAERKMNSLEASYEAACEASMRELARVLGVDPDAEPDDLVLKQLEVSLGATKEVKAS